MGVQMGVQMGVHASNVAEFFNAMFPGQVHHSQTTLIALALPVEFHIEFHTLTHARR